MKFNGIGFEKMKKVGIIGGAGDVGALVAYNLAIEGLADELILIDLLEDKAKAQANDIGHGLAWEKDVEIYQGGYEDAADVDIFVITAGKPREPGMSRLDLIKANKDIMNNISQKINKVNPEAITITTTNPLDIMNYSLYHYGDRPREKTLGEAGMLDSARFRFVLAKKFDVAMSDVEAYVIGEHGDSQVPLFSQIRIENERKSIEGEEGREKILETLQESAMKVIEGKGATVFGPSRGVTLMVDSILNDKGKVYPCSVVPEGEYGLEGASIGLPVKLGSNGVEEIVEWDITSEEKEKLENSHEKLEKVCKEEISK